MSRNGPSTWLAMVISMPLALVRRRGHERAGVVDQHVDVLVREATLSASAPTSSRSPISAIATSRDAETVLAAISPRTRSLLSTARPPG